MAARRRKAERVIMNNGQGSEHGRRHTVALGGLNCLEGEGRRPLSQKFKHSWRSQCFAQNESIGTSGLSFKFESVLGGVGVVLPELAFRGLLQVDGCKVRT